MGVTWAADSATVYYTTVDEAWRPDTVWRHHLGVEGPAEQVFTEPDERFWVAVGRTRSDAYIVIAAGSAITSEVRMADASDPDAEFTVVLPRRDGVEYLRRARRHRRPGPFPDPVQRRGPELHSR